MDNVIDFTDAEPGYRDYGGSDSKLSLQKNGVHYMQFLQVITSCTSSIFQAQLDELQRLVPELKIASAVIHYDKSSPHLHVVAVPVADGYRKGMKKQVAKTKIFTQERLVGLQEAMHIHAQEQIRQCPNLFTGTSIKKIEKGHKYFTKEELGEYRAKKAEAAFH